MVLGIDLNDLGCRISYLQEGMAEPKEVSQITGREACIPMALAGIKGRPGEWLFGEEAVRSASQRSDVCVVESLLEKALADEYEVIFGHEYKVFDLLVIYISKLFALTSFISPWQGAERICITAMELGPKMVTLLKKVASKLDYPSEQMDFISRSESFFEFVMHQSEELWNRDVVLLECTKNGALARRFSVNRKTKPAVCRIYTASDLRINVKDDEALKAFCEPQVEGRIITSVYITGDMLTRDDIPKTTRFLRLKRRVFFWNNIYSEGACHAAMDRQKKVDRRRTYLYLGKDKLKSNVGLRAYNGQEEAYLSLVDAGINWYDVRVRKEIYLGKEKELRLLLTPLSGKNEHYAVVRLSDIPPRPEHTTRVRVSLSMDSEDFIRVTVEDLGFGEIFPSSGVKVSQEIAVNI